MNVKYLLIILLAVLSSDSSAQIKTGPVVKSTVLFHIKNLGLTVDGRIGGLKADVRFDPSDLPHSSIEASVDANTIDTDNDTRDDHLKSDSYFDVARYPAITMKSLSIVHRGGNKYVGIFDLTLKNVTRRIEVPFHYTEQGADGEFKGNFHIHRSDFGVGGQSLVMSDDVNVDIELITGK